MNYSQFKREKNCRIYSVDGPVKGHEDDERIGELDIQEKSKGNVFV